MILSLLLILKVHVRDNAINVLLLDYKFFYTLVFYFQRCEMKRLTDLSELLDDFNFHHRSSKPTSDLLARIVQSHAVAKVPKEGGRLILALFSVSPSLIPSLHEAVKQKLPGAPSKVAETYGDVYLRAWKTAEGEARSKLEDAIQARFIFGHLAWNTHYDHM